MRTVPELVFLNCCHLAARDAQTTLGALRPRRLRRQHRRGADRDRRALRRRCRLGGRGRAGARCSRPRFYDALLRRRPLHRCGRGGARGGMACQRRRQHLGRLPVLRRPGLDLATRPRRRAAGRRFTGRRIRRRVVGAGARARARDDLDPAALRRRRDAERRLAARRSATRSATSSRAFAPLWGGMGAVAEAFGLAFADARDLDKAIDWYRAAVAAADGSASFKAAEQLGNQLARRGEANLDLAVGRRDVEAAIEQLGRLVAMQPTAEREALARLGLQAAGDDRRAHRGEGPRGAAARRRGKADAPSGERLEALRAMALHYGNAERLARASDADEPVLSGQERDQRRAARWPSSSAGRPSSPPTGSRRCANRWRARRPNGPTSGRSSARSSCALLDARWRRSHWPPVAGA